MQEIEPHPEPSEVFCFILEGTGEITASQETVEPPMEMFYLKSGERKGIRYKEPLTILGVQETH